MVRAGRLVVLTSFLLGSFVLGAGAQWSLNHTFGAQVRCVYFLDQQGASSTGFVGLANTQIWRTVDNGLSWFQMTTPTSTIPLQITQFTFKNATQGWCSTREAGGGTPMGGVWMTTDGGSTWTAVLTGQTMVSIAYCSTSGALVGTSWSDFGKQSANSGSTWSNVAGVRQDGVTFSGADGVISNLAAAGFLYTSNGGSTWNAPAPTLGTECWSPYGVPGTTSFFACAEHLGPVYRSTDGGASWVNTYTFAHEYLTGCIMGTMTTIFVQTQSNGFFYSNDQGTTWWPVCGPSNTPDTRFYSKATEIFAGDATGNLWYTPDGTFTSPRTITLDKKSLSFSGSRCLTYDSIVHLFSGVGCSAATLVKVQVLAGAPSFSVNSGNVPRTINGRDSIHIVYSPSSSLSDSGKVLIEINLGTTILDTVITVYGTAKNSTSYSHIPSLSMQLPYACAASDSTFVIRNLSCDTLTLVSAVLTDSTYFHLTTDQLPRKIAPFDLTSILISDTAKQDGNFTSILKLHMLGGDGTPVDNDVPLSLSVYQGAHVQFQPLAASLPSRCYTFDSAIAISNSPCDTIVIYKAQLSDTTVFRMDPLTLPLFVNAGGSVVFHVHTIAAGKGIYTAKLKFRYLSGQRLIDTTIALSLTVLNDISGTANLPASISMGAVNVPCSDTRQLLTISNPLCTDVSVDRISWDGSDDEFWYDPITLPTTLPHDTGAISFVVHFKPNAVHAASNALRVTLTIEGRTFDTLIAVSGDGVSLYKDSLLTPALQYDTLLQCQTGEAEALLVNLSCDTVIATSASVGANGFTITSPALPQQIASGDTLRIHVKLSPQQGGDANDSVHIVIHNPIDGNDYVHTVALTGHVIPNIHSMSVSNVQIAANAIAACSALDTFVVIKNLGNCDDVVISDTSIAGYRGVTFDGPFSLPIVLHPNDSVRIGLLLSPDQDNPSTSQLRLSGTNIDTTLSINYSALPGAHVLALALPDSTYKVRPCQSLRRTYKIINTGCDSTTIDRLRLSATGYQTDFALVSAPTMPHVMHRGDTLTYEVSFAPSVTSGSDGAIVQVDARSAKFSYQNILTGNVIGTIPNARVTVKAHDGTLSTSAKAGDTVVISTYLLDDVGDSCGLSTVSYTLSFNSNLLTLGGVFPGSGWTIVAQNENNSGLYLKLQHVPGAIASGEMATCYFAAAVTDTSAGAIALNNLKFNESDPNYTRCTLTAQAMPEAVDYTMTDVCGTALLRDKLRGELLIDVISIKPNPAWQGASSPVLTFNLARASDVTFVVRDMLGREHTRMIAPFTSGIHSTPIMLGDAAEGTYFIEVISAGTRQVRKIAIESGR